MAREDSTRKVASAGARLWVASARVTACRTPTPKVLVVGMACSGGGTGDSPVGESDGARDAERGLPPNKKKSTRHVDGAAKQETAKDRTIPRMSTPRWEVRFQPIVHRLTHHCGCGIAC